MGSGTPFTTAWEAWVCRNSCSLTSPSPTRSLAMYQKFNRERSEQGRLGSDGRTMVCRADVPAHAGVETAQSLVKSVTFLPGGYEFGRFGFQLGCEIFHWAKIDSGSGIGHADCRIGPVGLKVGTRAARNDDAEFDQTLFATLHAARFAPPPTGHADESLSASAVVVARRFAAHASRSDLRYRTRFPKRWKAGPSPLTR